MEGILIRGLEFSEGILIGGVGVLVDGILKIWVLGWNGPFEDSRRKPNWGWCFSGPTRPGDWFWVSAVQPNKGLGVLVDGKNTKNMRFWLNQPFGDSGFSDWGFRLGKGFLNEPFGDSGIKEAKLWMFFLG